MEPIHLVYLFEQLTGALLMQIYRVCMEPGDSWAAEEDG